MTDRLPRVTIVRRIKAAPAKVWAAITQPDLMMQWWGPDAGPTLNVVADVRPGGRFSAVFRLLNGEEHNPTALASNAEVHNKLLDRSCPGLRAMGSLGVLPRADQPAKRVAASVAECWRRDNRGRAGKESVAPEPVGSGHAGGRKKRDPDVGATVLRSSFGRQPPTKETST